MIILNFDNIDTSKIINQMRQSVYETHQELTEDFVEKAEYDAAKDDCIFKTRDILLKMQADAEEESKLNQKRSNQERIISVLTLVVSALTLLVTVIQLLK